MSGYWGHRPWAHSLIFCNGVRRPRLQRRQKGGALVLELFMILALINARVSYNCISSSNPSLFFLAQLFLSLNLKSIFLAFLSHFGDSFIS
jgi:hypothetical protein